MSELIQVRTNIFYTKKDNKYIRQQEMIFLVRKVEYKMSNDQDVIRENRLEKFSFVIEQNNIDNLIKLLENLKNANEENLK